MFKGKLAFSSLQRTARKSCLRWSVAQQKELGCRVTMSWRGISTMAFQGLRDLQVYWTSLNHSVMGWMASPSTPNSHDKVLTSGISVWHLFAFFFSLFIFLNTNIFLINRLYFSVLGLWKNWKKNKEFSNTPFTPPSVYPVINILHWYDTFFFLQLMNQQWNDY